MRINRNLKNNRIQEYREVMKQAEKLMELKARFDINNEFKKSIYSLVPINGVYKEVQIKTQDGSKNEEYYKWQFIFMLVQSGLFNKDYLGAEIHFPKGSKGAKDLQVDSCIFASKDWLSYYEKWRSDKDYDALDWLKRNLIGVIEFKKPTEKLTCIRDVFVRQVRPAINESMAVYCVGFYYDEGRLYIFQKKNGKILRYDESKNKCNEISFDLPDAYYYIPSYNDIINRINKPSLINKSNRRVADLEPISGHTFSNIENVMRNILQAMDGVSLNNQKGYEILVQISALKIYDEVTNSILKFYITDDEYNAKLIQKPTQEFINRMKGLYNKAKIKYVALLQERENTINWGKEEHVKLIKDIVKNFQDYSFSKSFKNHLYQIVFHRFANEFKKEEGGQFITPLPIIDFLVKIVNPKNNETVCDPTCGIADFLSLSFINSRTTAEEPLDDSNLYGLDNDEQMIMLAQFNMLLNGDGKANIKKVGGDKGSLLYKIATNGELIELLPAYNKNGKWDNRPDDKALMKFDVILTNPPFGENRPYRIKNTEDKELAECYELWNVAKQKDWIDKGILFLENAYRLLNENGRLGIVLSNSILSIDRWKEVRKWILDNLRIVAIFDLPPNVFADTGSNTVLLVAYKPSKDKLKELQNSNYEIFVRDIKKVGYVIKSIGRVKQYVPIYKRKEGTFEIEIDETGEPKKDEELSDIVKEFKEWIKTQEEALVNIFG